MRRMNWSKYVKQTIGNDRQVDVARKTGIDQTTISRWLNPDESTTRRISSAAVSAFARGYNRPVLEAFVVAGFLTSAEAGVTVVETTNLADIPSDELIAEINRRLAGSSSPRRASPRRAVR